MAARRPEELVAALAAHWAEHQERAWRSTQAQLQLQSEPEPEPEPEPLAPASAQQQVVSISDVDDSENGDGSASADGSDMCDFLDDIGGDTDSSSGGDADGGASSPDTAAGGGDAAAGADTIVQLVRLLKAATGRAPCVLDIGCGDGALLLRLHEAEGLPWSHLVGITADEPAAGEWDLRTHHAEAAGCVTVADFERFSSTTTTTITTIDMQRHTSHRSTEDGFDWSRRFDLVVSLHTFHHLLDPMGAVHSAFGLLNPGTAHCLFQVQSRASASESLQAAEKWNPRALEEGARRHCA